MAGKDERLDVVLTEFVRRLMKEWLPAFCEDPKRRYSMDGFDSESIEVSSHDARDFMRALDCGLVVDTGGGRYRAPQSHAFEQIFWEGDKTVNPRLITLWLEPIITIAALARLHLDSGWPKKCLGTQSKTWAFDLLAVRPGEENSHIVGEVKKTRKELDSLLRYMDECCARALNTTGEPPSSRRNAYRKWQALVDSPVPIFWAIGPDGDSRVYSVERISDNRITLHPVSESALAF